MAAEYRRMEESLRRTSERAREVLERARRRDVDWEAIRRQEGIWTQDAEDDETPPTLEEAFTAMSHFMHHTTELCKAYHHSCIPPRGINEQEKQHIGRFHHRGSQRAAQRPDPRLSSPSALLPPSGMKRMDPRDIYIEVAPGRYRISASSPDGPAQTHIVNVTPGQSVDLTFHV